MQDSLADLKDDYEEFHKSGDLTNRDVGAKRVTVRQFSLLCGFT